MSKFGWCFGPEGVLSDHDSCPVEVGSSAGIVRCGCPCHDQNQALGEGPA